MLYSERQQGLSRAQLTRLIGQYLATGKIEERGYRRRRFPKPVHAGGHRTAGRMDEPTRHLAGQRRQKICTGSFTSLGNRNMSGWRSYRWRTCTTCARQGRIESGGWSMRGLDPRQ